MKDENFAKRLHEDLRHNGIRVWFAGENLSIGDDIQETIDQSIRVYDKLLLVLSKKSVESDWVRREVETALEKEAARGETVLFPICLEDLADVPAGHWAAPVLRDRYVENFSGWKDYDQYQGAFKRLLKGLTASMGAKGTVL